MGRGQAVYSTSLSLYAYLLRVKQPSYPQLACPLYRRYAIRTNPSNRLTVVEFLPLAWLRSFPHGTCALSITAAERAFERDSPFFPPTVLGRWYCGIRVSHSIRDSFYPLWQRAGNQLPSTRLLFLKRPTPIECLIEYRDPRPHAFNRVRSPLLPVSLLIHSNGY